MSRYIVDVVEELMSEVVVEADNVEDAKHKALRAVWNRQRNGGTTLHHDSNTRAVVSELPPEYQVGGEYYNEEAVE